MPGDTIKYSTQIHKYILEKLEDENSVLKELRNVTSKMPDANMLISYEQAQFMSLILKAIGAKNTIELGVYTGYSTLITALALPDDGRVVACDINAEWADIGKVYWERSGVDKKIHLVIAPASETLNNMIANGESNNYDFAFIDADKTGYGDYYEKCLTLLKPGGLIMVDNAIWGGTVIDMTNNDEETVAMRTLNDKIAQDDRVNAYIVPIRDGIYLVYKK